MAVHQVFTQIGLKKRLYYQLEPRARDAGGLSLANAIIVALVLLSFLALALETEPALPDDAQIAIDWFNYFILAVFALEYLARLWCAGEDPNYAGLGGRLRYIASPYALADLIAFAPELIWLIVMGGESEEALMVLRILRLARLIKIARFVPAFDVLGAAMRRAGGQLLTTLALALALVYISAVMLYLIEGIGEGRPEFASIPRAIWWAIATLTTVGYGDVYPITPLGRFAASVIALAGIGVVALPAGVFASAFSDELRERSRTKRRAEREQTATPENDGMAPEGVDAP